MKKISFVALILCSVFLFVACTPTGGDGDIVKTKTKPTLNFASSSDLMQNVTSTYSPVSIDYSAGDDLLEFFVNLFAESCKGSSENVLVSPLSVVYALAMTANGARGETLAQMERAFNLSVGELNEFLYGYKKLIETDVNLNVGNAIWFSTDRGFTVDQGFLQVNADYYGAGLYSAPFDQSTLDEINAYVKAYTDGMIEKILDNISSDAVMYLVNALAFNADWQTRFNGSTDANFYYDGANAKTFPMLSSTESTYLHDDGCVGAMKYYDGGRYAFVGILPNDAEQSISEFAKSLTAERIRNLMQSKYTNCDVVYTMPKFSCGYTTLLNDVLVAMGITDAFDGNFSDFSAMGTTDHGEPLVISRVLHKTFIEVQEEGTRAGAATVVEMEKCTSVGPTERQTYYVNLNRPFVYMIWDTRTNLPIFEGTFCG